MSNENQLVQVDEAVGTKERRSVDHWGCVGVGQCCSKVTSYCFGKFGLQREKMQ